jgi:hypothetical protein
VLGYPILSVRSLPRDAEYTARYFAPGEDPLDINDVWPENYSANSAQKVWAAAFASHHPNVVVLDLSSFKCGHDAPTYGLVDTIIEKSKTPYAALHDIDANKPGGSIKIRVKTYAHTLKLHEERLHDMATRKAELMLAIDKKRLELLELREHQLAARRVSDPVIAQQIRELRERISDYRLPTTVSAANDHPQRGSGLVQLGKKTKDGVVPAGAESAEAMAGE